MDTFKLRIIPGGEAEIVQAQRIPAVGEQVMDGMGGTHTVIAVVWSGAYEPDGIRILLAGVVAQ